MMPALMVCTSSPMPGTRITNRPHRPGRTISTSSCPTPTVLDQNGVFAPGIEHGGNIGGGAGQAAQKSPGGHASDKDACIGR